LVADSSRARIFESRRVGSFKEVRSLVHPESRLHARDLKDDRPGLSYHSSGLGKDSMSPPTDPKDKEAMEFAKTIVDHVEKARSAHRFRSLVVVAAPAFLGLLRERYSRPLADLIMAEIDRDLSGLRSEEIREHLDRILPLGLAV
jgi:protein required for attachment to host cells